MTSTFSSTHYFEANYSECKVNKNKFGKIYVVKRLWLTETPLIERLYRMVNIINKEKYKSNVAAIAAAVYYQKYQHSCNYLPKHS